MAFEKPISKFLTGFARVFGVLCLLVAIVALISAAADSGNRVLFIVLGVGLLIAGVAFLRVKRLTPADIDRFRSIGK
jgi:hypothetical protein